jgi:hypothetical protein
MAQGMEEVDYHTYHGTSVAAWTGVGVMVLGALIGSLGVIWSSWPVIIAGLVVAAVGVVAGKVLAMAGFGVDKAGTTHSKGA